MKTSIIYLQYVSSNSTAYGELLGVCVAYHNLLFGYSNYTENLLVTDSFNADSFKTVKF